MPEGLIADAAWLDKQRPLAVDEDLPLLPKPFSSRELSAKVREVLDG